MICFACSESMGEPQFEKALGLFEHDQPKRKTRGHDPIDLWNIYLTLQPRVEKIGLEKACEELAGKVDQPYRKGKYSAGGLKTLYIKAKKDIEARPEFAALAHVLRGGLFVTGDKVVIPHIVDRNPCLICRSETLFVYQNEIG